MDVLTATRQRIAAVFGDCDNVYVSFSGGKDSGVLLNLAVEEWRKRPGCRLSVFHIDYEAQYQATTDYVRETFETLRQIGVEIYHCCLPIAAQCATSMHQSYWIPWEEAKREIWVRELPEHSVNEHNCEFDFFRPGIWDYDLQAEFGEWLHRKHSATKTACLVGIRTQESLNRWRAIHARGEQHTWTSDCGNGVSNYYPIFDWQTEDIWTANARFGWSYNKLYDLFYQAGVSIDKMRVASPFNDYAKESLALYRVIDPRNWGRMIGRVDGVNFTGIYGGTTAMGWRSIKLPPGHTWKSYLEFLLSTLPAATRQGYQEKLAISINFWREQGGCLSDETIASLKTMGIAVDDSGTTNRKTSKRPVRMEYLDDCDLPEFKAIPSYKRMCVCILKNDHMCKYMGFTPSRHEVERRKAAEQMYRDCLAGATNDED